MNARRVAFTLLIGLALCTQACLDDAADPRPPAPVAARDGGHFEPGPRPRPRTEGGSGSGYGSGAGSGAGRDATSSDAEAADTGSALDAPPDAGPEGDTAPNGE